MQNGPQVAQVEKPLREKFLPVLFDELATNLATLASLVIFSRTESRNVRLCDSHSLKSDSVTCCRHSTSCKSASSHGCRRNSHFRSRTIKQSSQSFETDFKQPVEFGHSRPPTGDCRFPSRDAIELIGTLRAASPAEACAPTVRGAICCKPRAPAMRGGLPPLASGT